MFELFKKDVQRWADPDQQWVGSSDVELPSASLITTLKLLYRHLPLRAMLWFRFGSWCNHKGIPFMSGFTQRLIYQRYGLEISPGADIGGGLYIAHPVGTVIMVNRMGENCSIISSVTIGLRKKHAFPKIGNNVVISSGARVLGDIVIGDGAVIGANAVVITDIPEGGTAVGIPAKVISIKGQKA